MKEKRRNVICLVTNIFEEDFINSLTEDERRNMQYIRQDTILFNDPQKRERHGFTDHPVVENFQTFEWPGSRISEKRVEKTLWLLNNIIVISTKKHKTTKENYQEFLSDFPTLDLAHKHRVMIYFSIQGMGYLLKNPVQTL